MKLRIEYPDGTLVADTLEAYARENGLPASVCAQQLLASKVEKRPHGLREPGATRKRQRALAEQRQAAQQAQRQAQQAAQQKAKPAAAAG